MERCMQLYVTSCLLACWYFAWKQFGYTGMLLCELWNVPTCPIKMHSVGGHSWI